MCLKPATLLLRRTFQSAQIWIRQARNLLAERRGSDRTSCGHSGDKGERAEKERTDRAILASSTGTAGAIIMNVTLTRTDQIPRLLALADKQFPRILLPERELLERLYAVVQLWVHRVEAVLCAPMPRSRLTSPSAVISDAFVDDGVDSDCSDSDLSVTFTLQQVHQLIAEASRSFGGFTCATLERLQV